MSKFLKFDMFVILVNGWDRDELRSHFILVNMLSREIWIFQDVKPIFLDWEAKISANMVVARLIDLEFIGWKAF